MSYKRSIIEEFERIFQNSRLNQIFIERHNKFLNESCPNNKMNIMSLLIDMKKDDNRYHEKTYKEFQQLLQQTRTKNDSIISKRLITHLVKNNNSILRIQNRFDSLDEQFDYCCQIMNCYCDIYDFMNRSKYGDIIYNICELANKIINVHLDQVYLINEVHFKCIQYHWKEMKTYADNIENVLIELNKYNPEHYVYKPMIEYMKLTWFGNNDCSSNRMNNTRNEENFQIIRELYDSIYEIIICHFDSSIGLSHKNKISNIIESFKEWERRDFDETNDEDIR